MSVDDEPPLVVIKLVIAATLLLFEAIFAASEIGLLGASRIRIKHLAAEGDRRAKLVERLRANPTRMVATVLIAITALLYFSEALATHSALELSAPWLHWLGPVLFLIGALIFCELTPILYASIHPERTAIFCAPFVLVVQWVFAPVLWVIGHVTAVILRLLRCDPEAKPPLITEGEMAAILETAERDGILESEERRMLLGALEFTDFHVSEVMIPKAEIIGLPREATLEEAVREMVRSGHGRLPVWEGGSLNVVGVLYSKDALGAWRKGDRTVGVEALQRSPFFTRSTERGHALLRGMQREQRSIAIVRDDRDHCVGLVTVVDLVRELLGGIAIEDDSVVPNGDRMPFVTDRKDVDSR